MEPTGDPGHSRGQAVVGGRRGRQRNGRGPAPLLRGGHGSRLRGVGERGRGQGHGPRQRQQQQRVSNEMRAIVVDQVIDHGMTMTEAATMIQPNNRRSTVASIIRTFRNENRIETRPNRGGRGKIRTDQQEQAVVNLVRARNDIRLTEIRQHILDNEDMFNNVESGVMELDADDNHHKFIYLDEAGFNLAKTRRRGRNFIGQQATSQVPGNVGPTLPCCDIRRWCDGTQTSYWII
ncbi:uncharacterized protein LOC105028496 [Esox lucius]|uniref:uncharacterized protein LOC105028496 n=1 Tax=Esox lucius TaxID=8010 RepID=UPI000661C7A2|nr:uncharacterized protein LOC105028496 [Esox lucius]